MALSKLCNKLDPEIGRRLQFRYTELQGGRKGRNSYMYINVIVTCIRYLVPTQSSKQGESWYKVK